MLMNHNQFLGILLVEDNYSAKNFTTYSLSWQSCRVNLDLIILYSLCMDKNLIHWLHSQCEFKSLITIDHYYFGSLRATIANIQTRFLCFHGARKLIAIQARSGQKDGLIKCIAFHECVMVRRLGTCKKTLREPEVTDGYKARLTLEFLDITHGGTVSHSL